MRAGLPGRPIAPTRPARLPSGADPVLSIVVDCEEEFDWATPVRGTPYTLNALSRFGMLAERARRIGVTLTCLATAPVLDDDQAWGHLAAIETSGDAVLGVHLHPWVTPPYGEAETIANSFQGNLAPEREAAKIATMVARFQARTGRPPLIFKAGRSGFGPNTAAALAAQGFGIDLSFMPAFDYSHQGGPNFIEERADPFFFETADGPLLEIPDTGGFLGRLRRHGSTLYPLADAPSLRALRLRGILSRTGLLDRVPLTPEGIPQAEARRLTAQLRASGQQAFQLSFHSTSLIPGGTGYTRDEAGVAALLDWLDSYVGFFRKEIGGRVVTPLEILDGVSGDHHPR